MLATADATPFTLGVGWAMLASLFLVVAQYGFAKWLGGHCMGSHLMTNMFNMTIVSTAYLLVGHFLASEDHGKLFPGDIDLAADAAGAAAAGTDDAPQMHAVFRHMANVAIIATLASHGGTVSFNASLIYNVLLAAVIYPMGVRFTTRGGMLNDNSDLTKGISDDAGAGVMMMGGVAALAISKLSGGRADKDDDVDSEKASTGAFFLMIAFIMNAMGSGQTYNGVTRAAVSTVIAASAGGLITHILNVAQKKDADMNAYCRGMLCGMVSVMGCCTSADTWVSFAVGAVGALMGMAGTMIAAKVNIEDHAGAFACHGMAGFWGLLAAGLFAGHERGVLMGGKTDVVFMPNLICALFDMVMVFVATFIVGTLLKLVKMWGDEETDVTAPAEP